MIVEDRPYDWKRPLEEVMALAYSMGITINEVTIPKTVRVFEDVKEIDPNTFECDFGNVKVNIN